MTVFIGKVTKSYVELVKKCSILNFVNPITQFCMKRVLALIALVGLLASCSQYTCPTYSKKEVKKTEHKI